MTDATPSYAPFVTLGRGLVVRGEMDAMIEAQRLTLKHGALPYPERRNIPGESCGLGIGRGLDVKGDYDSIIRMQQLYNADRAEIIAADAAANPGRPGTPTPVEKTAAVRPSNLVEMRSFSVTTGHISDAVDDVLALPRDADVLLIFNDLLLTVSPDDDRHSMQDKWNKAVDARNG